jgi:hypothetical protein
LRPADLLVLERRDALLQPLDDGDEPEPVRKRQRLVRREIFLQRLRSSQYCRHVNRVPKFGVFLPCGGEFVDGCTVGCLSLIDRAGRGREVLAISYGNRTDPRAAEVFDVLAIMPIDVGPGACKIAPVTSYRPAAAFLPDKNLPDQPRGVIGELVDAAQSRPGAVLAPQPAKAPPAASLAQRIRDARAKGG